jgi:hypothetical protein
MNVPLKYPLEQLMLIKKNRFDQAVKTLEEKRELLAKAHEVLFKVSAERDTALQHKQDKLTQLRAALDEGTTSDKIQQMKVYLKIVDEKLAAAQKKVLDAQGKVDLAQKQVDIATQEVFQRKKDVEKIEMHKVEWEKEAKYGILQKETSEQDEQGSSTYTTRKRAEELRNKRELEQ